MAEKELNSRIIHKHDSAENWAKATNFIPKQGEIIVYDRDTDYTYERIKIGDGVTNVNSLPFLLDTAPGSCVATAASTDGIAYTATILAMDELAVGASFIMIPGRVSANTQPTLDVNGFGAKPLRRRLSNLATGVQAGYTTTWLAANMPYRVMYDGTNWIVEGQNRPASVDLYGNVPIAKGGTGASTAEEALQNLGIYIGDTEPTDTNIRIWINTSEEGTGVTPLLPRIATVTLPASGWTGSNPYSQTVAVSTLTATDRVELCPTPDQILSLQNDDIALLAENNNGTLIIYSMGGVPSSDMTMQILLTTVSYV